jgi:hypothetical protein
VAKNALELSIVSSVGFAKVTQAVLAPGEADEAAGLDFHEGLLPDRAVEDRPRAMITGFKALGADARPLAFPDLYGALSAGEFQGQVQAGEILRGPDGHRCGRQVTQAVLAPGEADEAAGDDAGRGEERPGTLHRVECRLRDCRPEARRVRHSSSPPETPAG